MAAAKIRTNPKTTSPQIQPACKAPASITETKHHKNNSPEIKVNPNQ